MIHIFKSKNEDAAIAYSLCLTAASNVRSETFIALSENKMKLILESAFNPYDLLRSELEDYMSNSYNHCLVDIPGQ
ncbi:MAG: hypothetical protein HN590_08705 [Calditrichaeota bacterium]|nr:hypothetical protein [Calditrichota bacterium]MBT7790857.1 hypothetical protein [Calditrichota bacterium]